MGYKVRIKESVLKDLKRIDKKSASELLDFIEAELSLNPHKGKPLRGKFKGLWRYRYRSYRILYEIRENLMLILVLRISHRKEAYKGIL